MTFSNYSSLNYLFNLQRNTTKYNLDNTYKLLEPLGNPQNRLRCIHIAGTNGKGSVSAMICKVLMEKAITVGLYTSPHLLSFNERIKVNSIPITNQEIETFVKKYKVHISNIGCSFFEVTTAMALKYFVSRNVEVAVIETGLGGRLDSTNVINPDLAVITPISLDHRQVLGDNLVKIAFEKSGIIKPGIPVILSEQKKEVQKVFNEKAKELNCSIKIIQDSMVKNIKVGIKGTSFSYLRKQYNTNLVGRHQARNTALAIGAAKIFEPTIKEKSIHNGLEKVYWPGRLEQLENFIFFDVAHNQSSIFYVIRTMKTLFPRKDLVALLCLKAEKEPILFAEYFKLNVNKLYITSDKNGILMDPIELSQILLSYGCKNRIVKNIKYGIDKVKFNVNQGSVGLVLGSHFIAEEVYKEFQISFDTGQI